MPAIASLEDLRAAQEDLLEAKDLNELKVVFKRWRGIGWRNVCKLCQRKGSGKIMTYEDVTPNALRLTMEDAL